MPSSLPWKFVLVGAVATSLGLVVACGSETTGGGGSGGSTTSSGGGTGGTISTGGSGGDDCLAEELCDGVDNDCDGTTDEDCDCIEGETRDCYTGDPDLLGIGACQYGVETCDLYGAWGSCEGEGLPVAEICDGIDNDCNGVADEGMETVTCGLGICQQTVESCVDGEPIPCIPGDPQPPEDCDGSDDDCDGEVDEGCTCLDTDPPVDCYSGSLATRGVGECHDGQATCQGGVLGPCLDDQTPVQEICNGLDDDCDGTDDDGDPGSGGVCPTGGLGICAQGVNHCVNGAITCVPPTPQTEICNLLDDDCDGTPDDGDPGGGAACATGQPGVCANGTEHCLTGSIQCVAPQPQGESCNGLDDDCDGIPDDGNPGGGGACSTGLPGVCAQGQYQCQNGSLNCVAPSPGTETCNLLDDDCDGIPDDGNPGGGNPCSTGQPGACANGTTQCIGGSIQCVAPLPSPEQCNGIDDNCDGAIDNGNPGGGAACNTGQPGICAAGTTQCQGGQLNCVANNSPVNEICTDNLDNDCNGTINNGCCTNSIVDGNFEAGAPWPAWTQTSLQYTTPMCDEVGCGTGGGTGPRSGLYWAWLGGYDGHEVASVAQSVVIPPGAVLSFWLEIPACAASGTDVFQVRVDGSVVYSTNNNDPTCDQLGYVEHVIDLSAWDDGGSHTIMFWAEVFGSGPPSTSITNFMVDDVALNLCIP